MDSGFASYYDLFKDKIYSYLYYRTGRNRQLAEDLVSEVFLKALEKFHSYRVDSSFQSWIYAIAHNHLVDYFRKSKTTVDLEEMENVLVSEGDPKAMLMRRIAAEEVEELLQYLSDDEKEMVLMRYHADMSTKEIADIVDKPDATVRVALHRALAKLRHRYPEYSSKN
jgi:RNA polymerase sigma-70 factor (ECF subfamily)